MLVGHQAVKILVGVLKRAEVFLALIGGIKETQNMLDFCAQHQIESDIELIPIQQVNEAYERVIRGDVKVSIRDRHGVAEIARTSCTVCDVTMRELIS